MQTVIETPSTPIAAHRQTSFRAPWSPTLRFITLLLLFISGVATLLTWCLPSQESPFRPYWVTGIAAIFVSTGFLFSVRGYHVTPTGLRIVRGGWSTHLQWEDLDSIEFNPNVARNCWRLFGIGPFFGYTGWFWNSKLSFFKLYGTDLSICVLMRFGSRRIVITPDPPLEFVRAVDRVAWATQRPDA